MIVNTKADIKQIDSPCGSYSFYTYEYCSAYSGSFGNCQNFTVNNFCYFLEDNSNDDDIELSDQELARSLNNFLYFVSRTCNKFFAVIDINEWVYETLKEWITDYKLEITLIVETPYTNNNGSEMYICILNLNNLKAIE